LSSGHSTATATLEFAVSPEDHAKATLNILQDFSED
jgi:hypothetical protein